MQQKARHSGRDTKYGPSDRRVEPGAHVERLVALAQDVAIQRGALVAETLFHVAAIRSLQRSPATGAAAAVHCVRAAVQDTTAQHGQQAAHLLPGVITVNGKPVWAYADVDALATRLPDAGARMRLRDEVTRLALQTMECFAKTNVLPAVFNRADSQAERMAAASPVRGLKPLLGARAQRLWSSARVDPARPLAIDRGAALGALESWFAEVSAVYRAAADRKRVAWADAAKAGRDGADDREMESRILETYADSFQVRNVARFMESHAAPVYHRYDWL